MSAAVTTPSSMSRPFPPAILPVPDFSAGTPAGRVARRPKPSSDPAAAGKCDPAGSVAVNPSRRPAAVLVTRPAGVNEGKDRARAFPPSIVPARGADPGQAGRS